MCVKIHDRARKEEWLLTIMKKKLSSTLWSANFLFKVWDENLLKHTFKFLKYSSVLGSTSYVAEFEVLEVLH